MSTFSLCPGCCPVKPDRSLFLTQGDANSVLRRVRRSNTLLEELRRDNLERECLEEVCTYEEAREVFENYERTNEFWTNYIKEQNENQENSSGVNMESVYLVAPLIAGLLMIVIILFVIWRCQVRKANHRQNAYAQSRQQANQPARNVSVVVFNCNEHPVSPFDRLHTQQPDAMTAHISNGNGLPIGTSVHSTDLPPTYDEAMRQVSDIRIDGGTHTEDPPNYEEIVTPTNAANNATEVARNVRRTEV
ncbi:transmembrane gamma-carboxyglutamic acid protein 1-like [Scyliorhinus canicula]|uniref:transmembrane gamma-carboxyglutamic acid protein 1-like n=1 Tax=Scyliorhinus canicula TaxID=7830 RepID=UPI0018F5B4D8|nr:transmembrane gamma-carboxyglutamic acid protein 1-like [Scyliorhinus canicula]